MGAVISRSGRSTDASDIRWAFGCGFPVIIALAFATVGTFIELRLVARAHVYCAGHLSMGENFAGSIWAMSRIVLFVGLIYPEIRSVGSLMRCGIDRLL